MAREIEGKGRPPPQGGGGAEPAAGEEGAPRGPHRPWGAGAASGGRTGEGKEVRGRREREGLHI
jgi:hypothetical protein